VDYTPLNIVFIALAFIVAGMVKGVIGLGLPTIAIGLLTLRIGTAEAVAMLAMPTVITNLWQLLTGPRFFHLLRRFKVLLATGFVGIFIGVRLLVDGGMAGFLLGLLLAGYGLLGLSKLKFSLTPRWEARLSPVAGLATGVLYGSTGLGVSSIPYITALGLEREELVQAMGLLFSTLSLAMAVALTLAGKFQPSIATTSVLALLPAMAGMMLGQKLRQAIDQEQFRKVFFAAMVLLGAYTAFHALH
jgi:uncharacterized protein